MNPDRMGGDSRFQTGWQGPASWPRDDYQTPLGTQSPGNWGHAAAPHLGDLGMREGTNCCLQLTLEGLSSHRLGRDVVHT